MIQFLSLIALAFALVQGISTPKSVVNGISPLKLDFNVSKEVGNESARNFWAKNNKSLMKKDAFAETILNYRDLSYQMNIYLGSNKEQNTVVIDTGSSDLWVPNSGYNPENSNSSIKTGYPFSVTYLNGVSATGDFVLDSISFDSENPTLSNFQFAHAAGDGPGIMGIADKNLEKSPCVYNNLPWALQAAGIINKAAYSLFLGSHGQSGSLIFGGIDTEKYTGELVKYPIEQNTGHLAIELKSVSFNGNEYAVNTPALLDSGSSLGLLNQQLMSELDVVFNTTVAEIAGIGYRYTSCDQPTDKTIEINFGANSISIPYADAVVPQGDGTCMLGFAHFNDYNILGDVFLRKAYAYFDLTGQTISLAQASYSEFSNIIST